MSDTCDKEERILKPVKPPMSRPWFDAKRPRKPESVRHSVESGEKKYSTYWGDIHGHSNMSADSWYHSPDGYYKYGRDTANLDFCAVTDHDAPMSLAKFPHRWEKCLKATEKYHDPGSFVTLNAFEWTSGTPEGSMIQRFKPKARWNYLNDPRHFGHRNVYFPGDDVPGRVFSHDDDKYGTPEKLWAAMKPYGAISIPHHPLGGPTCPLNWEQYDPEMEPVVEIYSTHGSSECEGAMHEIYNPYRNGRHSVRAPLDMGKRFGFIASSDTHKGLAGNYTGPDFNISFSQWYFRGRNRPPGPGVAVLYLENLSREAIFEAIRTRRTYAVTGARIVLDVRAGDHFMGSAFAAGESPVKISIFVSALEPLYSVEVIKNGKTAATFSSPENEAEFEYTDERREKEEDYLYVRVIQRDAHMAWSSPIWISR